MMTPKEAAGMARNGFAVIVDVREADEIKEEGIAEGAVHIPIDEIESDSQQWKDFSKKIKPDQKVAFYCRSGGRAGRAASHAAKQGMSAANIGGLKDWIEAGLPVKKN